MNVINSTAIKKTRNSNTNKKISNKRTVHRKRILCFFVLFFVSFYLFASDSHNDSVSDFNGDFQPTFTDSLSTDHDTTYSDYNEDLWWVGKVVSGFQINGLKNVSSYDFNDILYQYRNQILTEELVDEIESKITGIKGIRTVSTGAFEGVESDEVKLFFSVTEYQMVSAIATVGNAKVKKSDIHSAIEKVKIGQFIDSSLTSLAESIKKDVESLYQSKGFGNIPVSVSYAENKEQNTVEFEVNVTEGIQTRIISFFFEGNENVSSSVLKKKMTSKAKNLFNQGYYSEANIEKDKTAIESYYKTVGFIDAKVIETKIEDVESKTENYRDISVTYVISENDKWYYSGMDIQGNTIFSNEDFESVMTLIPDTVLNLQLVLQQYSNVADVYYNNGYISNKIEIEEQRNDEDKTVFYHIFVVEGPQAKIEKIVISGLTKTKEYVMRRELTLSEGDVFSKNKLQTSAQNLYNTGLLTNVDYNIYYGTAEDYIILEFILEEGNQMDIQFGATFGGSVNGFPVSGFLQWSNHNFAKRGQDISVSTTLSPDSQAVSLSFGDSWIGNKRWAYSIALSFNHTNYPNELQKGIGSLQFNGWNDESVWPLGYSSYSDWKNNNFVNPSDEKLMSYDLFNINLSFSTGYTFIFDIGRLTLSTGFGIGLNHAQFDTDKFIPYESLISKYREGFKFSNKLNLGIQWDGRDYITNTTKGYVVSSNITYAGGLFGGLSNYIKTSLSATGYLKICEVGSEEKKKNIMFSASSSISFMLPQLYVNNEDETNPGFGFHNAKLGATKYEMLYIDGITIARGHNVVTGQSFLWDNMFEVSYPLAENILNAEVFLSATALASSLSEISKSDWYFSAGAGIRLKISGFPLGLYIVKNAVKPNNSSWKWIDGSVGGMNLVVAISTSLI